MWEGVLTTLFQKLIIDGVDAIKTKTFLALHFRYLFLNSYTLTIFVTQKKKCFFHSKAFWLIVPWKTNQNKRGWSEPLLKQNTWRKTSQKLGIRSYCSYYEHSKTNAHECSGKKIELKLWHTLSNSSFISFDYLLFANNLNRTQYSEKCKLQNLIWDQFITLYSMSQDPTVSLSESEQVSKLSMMQYDYCIDLLLNNLI